MAAHFDQIKSAFDRFLAAWKTNDGATLASFFVEVAQTFGAFAAAMLNPAPPKTPTNAQAQGLSG
jgi:hypothetical protein